MSNLMRKTTIIWLASAFALFQGCGQQKDETARDRASGETMPAEGKDLIEADATQKTEDGVINPKGELARAAELDAELLKDFEERGVPTELAEVDLKEDEIAYDTHSVAHQVAFNIVNNFYANCLGRGASWHEIMGWANALVYWRDVSGYHQGIRNLTSGFMASQEFQSKWLGSMPWVYRQCWAAHDYYIHNQPGGI